MEDRCTGRRSSEVFEFANSQIGRADYDFIAVAIYCQKIHTTDFKYESKVMICLFLGCRKEMLAMTTLTEI